MSESYLDNLSVRVCFDAAFKGAQKLIPQFPTSSKVTPCVSLLSASGSTKKEMSL